MGITLIPWLLALATAVWFGLMARRAGRSWFLWAAGGGLFALAAATIVLGLGHSTAIPFSDRDRTRLQIEWTLTAIVVIAALGWLFTINLHRQHLALWERAKQIFPIRNQSSSTGAKDEARKRPPKRV